MHNYSTGTEYRTGLTYEHHVQLLVMPILRSAAEGNQTKLRGATYWHHRDRQNRVKQQKSILRTLGIAIKSTYQPLLCEVTHIIRTVGTYESFVCI